MASRWVWFPQTPWHRVPWPVPRCLPCTSPNLSSVVFSARVLRCSYSHEEKSGLPPHPREHCVVAEGLLLTSGNDPGVWSQDLDSVGTLGAYPMEDIPALATSPLTQACLAERWT